MFGKKFLKDKDLEFLEECSNEDLKVLADLLVYDLSLIHISEPTRH